MITLCSVERERVTLQMTVDISGSMLEAEEKIQEALNEAGSAITSEALKRFDTDGSPIVTGAIKWTSKGQVEKMYQTPYGQAPVARHVYQTSEGGKTLCPLDRAARIMVSSTPRFAKMVSHKVANSATTVVQRDLEANHGRHVAREFVRDLADAVGTIAQAKEEDWHYETPKLDAHIASVAIGMDGTCMFISKDGWREAMTGTIALYDADGKRQHTIYIGATPEYGKAIFMKRMEQEIAHVKKLYPKADYVGIADGAQCNWTFLKTHTHRQIIDFWHAVQYLAAVAQAAFPVCEADRAEWLDERCHRLKHDPAAVPRLLKEMEEISEQKLPKTQKEPVAKAMTYFRNHQHQMNYADYRIRKLPIGSGVTEAACKTLVKQRLCSSGMKWLDHGASIVLSLRALMLTKERWDQFWSKVNQYGFSFA
jgi:hypothetical protein